jgi:hypothetical protein
VHDRARLLGIAAHAEVVAAEPDCRDLQPRSAHPSIFHRPAIAQFDWARTARGRCGYHGYGFGFEHVVTSNNEGPSSPICSSEILVIGRFSGRDQLGRTLSRVTLLTETPEDAPN